MAQFKRDPEIRFLSPLTSMHNFSEIRSHGAEVSGRDFATLYWNYDGNMQRIILEIKGIFIFACKINILEL